jgi:hypothetical protein
MREVIYKGEVAYKTKFKDYYVTKSGKLLTVKVKGGQGSVDYNNPREHSFKKDKDGYIEYCLSVISNEKHKRLYRRGHRIIWETFNGEIPKGMTIDHINNIPYDNRIENLQLLSRTDNTKKSVRRKSLFKGVLNDKRGYYDVYVNNIYKGTYKKSDMFELFRIESYDVTQFNKGIYTQNLINKKITLKLNVEDIERIG